MNLATDNSVVWSTFLHSVEQQLNKQIFDAWFRPIQFDGCDHDEKVLKLRASQVTRDWVSTYYNDLIGKILDDIELPAYSLEWEIDDGRSATDDSVIEEDDVDFFFEVQPSNNNFERQARGAIIHKSIDTTPVEAPPARIAVNNFATSEPIESSLNLKYSFSNFVVGSCNEFGHAAALAIAEAPGKTYNPLYLYGGVGLGKTHLMHAAGHAIKQRNPQMRVAYLSAEKFMNELVSAIRYDKTQIFRDKYRLIDVLMIDDVQFMAGKERTQEEFFHTFNALHNDQKQIVISSDCPPREIPQLEERLHSRFEWGLIADIEPPDLETKVAILKRKAELDDVHLSDDVALFIAGKVKNNIRELEGSLVRLIAISSLRGLPISKMLAQDALRNIIDNDEAGTLTMERIARHVAAHYRLSVDELKEKNNSRQIAVPRQVAMYLCKRLTKHSFPEIGREFAGKHHTTVMHSFEKITGLLKTDKDLHNTVSELIDALCG
jgi:chromosomal replication initiator protein